MVYTEFFKFALGDMKRKTIRTNLTILGIFVGVMTIIALMSLSNGLKNMIDAQFQSLGANKIMVMKMFTFGMSNNPITTADARFIEKIQGVKAVGYFVTRKAKIKFNDEEKMTTIFALPFKEGKRAFEDVEGNEIVVGRDIKHFEHNKVVIGHKLYQDFFDKKVDVRNNIKINGRSYKVIGVLEQKGNPDEDSYIYMTYKSAKELFNLNDSVSLIMVRSQDGVDPRVVAERIKKKMKDRRGADDVQVQTTDEVIQMMNTMVSGVQAVIVGIAFISLIVGGIGIMNTMYTSVLEQTRQIGIMKAIGARNSDIMIIFLIQSGFLGLIGGAVGVLLGLLIAKGITYGAGTAGYTMLTADTSPSLILFGLGFSFVVGSISGVLPAREAAKKHPVDALRS